MKVNVEFEEFNNLKINNDMASGIFQEIRETLIEYPCMHVKETWSHGTTPPMFFSEWIRCIISKARLQGIEAQCSILNIIYTQDEAIRVWNKFIEQGGINEVERPL